MSDKKVPKMIREDQPMIRPAPPALGAGIDAQTFDRRWAQEQRRAARKNEQVPPPSERLTDGFNRKADELGQSDARLDQFRAAEKQAVEQYLRQAEQGRPFAPELLARIRGFNRAAAIAETRHEQLLDSTKPVNKSSRHEDGFDRVDRQVSRQRSRGKQQGRT